MSFTNWLRNLRNAITPAPVERQRRRSARRLAVESLEDRLCPSGQALGVPLTSPDAVTQAHVSEAYGQLPLSFEANQGQTDTQINFLSRGSGYTLFLTPGEAVLSLAAGEANDVVRMRIVGADPDAQSAGLEEQAGGSNYLIGADPLQWHTDIANYGRVEYQDVYSGIDLVYYVNQRNLEYDFVVSPGADPETIRLTFDGAEGMTLDAAGNLVLHTPGGDVVQHAPVIYQESDGVRQTVAGRYVLEDNGQVHFGISAYDTAQTLVIDPVLSYSTYLGGSNGSDFSYAIAVDSLGNAYVTGETGSTNFPTKNPRQAASAGSSDVFVTKLNPTGTALIYSTYLGGSNPDAAYGIAADSAGNAYVVGATQSANFPVVNALDTSNSTIDAFLAQLSADGSKLLYSTYLGGSGHDRARAVALDGTGKAYVTGSAASDFPVTAGAFRTVSAGSTDGFVVKVDTSLSGASSLVYGTYLGGGYPSGIAVDGAGNAYVTGKTISVDFPVTSGAFQTASNDAFVTKLNNAGTAQVYSTFLGGSGEDWIYAIAVDGTGSAYVLGGTSSSNFPTLHPYQSAKGGGYDGFITRLTADGSALVYSTYLGGDSSDVLNSSGANGGIAIDGAGNAYIASWTYSQNFPLKNPLTGQEAFNGSYVDGFVAGFNTNQSGPNSLLFSTYLGGNDAEQCFAIAFYKDNATDKSYVYVAGETESNDFPVTQGVFQRRKGGGKHSGEGFVTKIELSAPLLTVSQGSDPTAPAVTASAVQPLLAEATAGFLDPTFAGDGMVATNFGLTDYTFHELAWDVAVYPGSSPGADGKILAVGSTVTRVGSDFVDVDRALVRYNPDSTLDAGFGQGGKVTTSMSTGYDVALSVQLVGTKILVGGITSSGGFALARYNDDGRLDTTFGVNGTVITKVSQGGIGLAMKVDSQGRIVTAGTDAKHQLIVARYTSNGSVDTTFGKRGSVITPLPQGVSGTVKTMDLAITPASAGTLADSIVVVAPPYNVSGTVTVARYTTAGVLDKTFDGDGLLVMPANSSEPSVAIQANGRIVVTTGRTDGVLGFRLIRLNTNGTFDTSFNGNGIVNTNPPEGLSLSPSSVALQADGKIVVAGRQGSPAGAIFVPGGNFFVARYTLAGILDTTFGNGGFGFSTDGSVGSRGVGTRFEVALQGNGKIVVAGYSNTFGLTGLPVTEDFAVARFEGDAALLAAAAPKQAVQQTLTATAVQPLLAEAVSRWQAAGAGVSGLSNIDIRVADLGGATLGLVSGHTTWLDTNAAGWGWFVDATPWDDSEFTTPGDQGEQHRMDLLTVLEHEIGHFLGQEHEADGLMADTLAPGVRRMPAGETDWLAAVEAALCESSARKRRS